MVRVRLSDATLVGSLSDFLRLSSLDPRRVSDTADLIEVTVSHSTVTAEAEIRLVSALVRAWQQEHRFDIVAEVTAGE
jgi:hypothetical protein